ncbi:Hypothetical predicted protein [Octopus vulgaris]|uniref:Uncharacterized protein n=1 Tax=Octopus vulgaris TaxID=6645 RepID=A0AA36B2G2_OCTVU|nr:Hypothetical predicted protein [Octopus vulgaris]
MSRSFLMAQYGDDTGNSYVSYASVDDCEAGDEMKYISEHPVDHPVQTLEVPQTQRQTRALLPKTKLPLPVHKEHREPTHKQDGNTESHKMRDHQRQGQTDGKFCLVAEDAALSTLLKQSVPDADPLSCESKTPSRRCRKMEAGGDSRIGVGDAVGADGVVGVGDSDEIEGV